MRIMSRGFSGMPPDNSVAHERALRTRPSALLATDGVAAGRLAWSDLARLMSALEAGEPFIRLYDPELRPQNARRYPQALRIPDSVRLLATVNHDDTVERLSPRLLSRAR